MACSSCWSTCCRAPFRACLTAEDLERLGAAGALAVPTTAAGYVAELPKDPDGACVFLRPDGCAVQETKPAGCAAFPAADCRYWAPNPAGARTLRVEV